MKLLFSNLHSISLNILFLLISISKQSSIPRRITSKDIQLISKGLPKTNNNINPSGTKTRRARSIKGKNTFKHIKNFALKLSFFDVIILTFLKASIIPRAHLVLCLPKSPRVSGTSVNAMAFSAKLVSYPLLNNCQVKTISSPTQFCHPPISFKSFVL